MDILGTLRQVMLVPTAFTFVSLISHISKKFLLLSLIKKIELNHQGGTELSGHFQCGANNAVQPKRCKQCVQGESTQRR